MNWGILMKMGNSNQNPQQWVKRNNKQNEKWWTANANAWQWEKFTRVNR